MTGFAFTWHGLRLEARCSGALWWPAERWLIVADLHLGKSERMARRGGALLPPYEGIETLRRLQAEAEALDPAVIVSLGDGFDDDAAAEAGAGGGGAVGAGELTEQPRRELGGDAGAAVDALALSKHSN